jgi:hypothetical protein
MWAGVTVMAVLFVFVLVRGPQRSPAAPAVETTATHVTRFGHSRQPYCRPQGG